MGKVQRRKYVLNSSSCRVENLYDYQYYVILCHNSVHCNYNKYRCFCDLCCNDSVSERLNEPHLKR